MSFSPSFLLLEYYTLISVPLVQRKDAVPHPMILFSWLLDVHDCIELRVRAHPVSVTGEGARKSFLIMSRPVTRRERRGTSSCQNRALSLLPAPVRASFPNSESASLDRRCARHSSGFQYAQTLIRTRAFHPHCSNFGPFHVPNPSPSLVFRPFLVHECIH
jgi:hypothetical protein